MQDNGTTQTTKKYYAIAGMRVAMDDGTDLVYFASDNLSSTSIVMDASGTLLSEQRYLPFGGVRADVGTLITETDFGYAGQRNLGDTGLMDYNARFYSPTLGRFIQPDTIIPGAENPQSWNRFSYVGNNPVKRIDPTGHIELELEPCGPGEQLTKNGCEKAGDGINPGDKGYCNLHPESYYCTGPTSDSPRGGNLGPPRGGNQPEKNQEFDPRTPDYYNLDINLGPLLFGVDFPFIIDRYGNLYFGVGVFLGPEGGGSPISGSLTAGWTNNGPLNEEDLSSYLSGGYADLSGGIIFGGGVQTTLSKDIIKKRSFELGLYIPGGGGLSAGYQWKKIEKPSWFPTWKP